jgi:thiosulfate/3-mercaptopyruvate sulfurtransferase
MSSFQSLVSVDWLGENLQNPNIKIIDCRFSLNDISSGRKQYEQEHILGAFYFDLNEDLSSPVEIHGGRHPLPDPLLFSQKLERIGIILGKTFVVAYDDTLGAFASRLWWLLRYFGHEKVAVLNGGWSAWKEKNYPITDKIPLSQTGIFKPQLQSNWVYDRNEVIERKNLPEVVLIDSREGDRYRGENEPIDPIAGHIPGALNLPWKTALDDKGYFKSPEEQKDRWSDYKNKEEIIVYCGSGVTACVNLFSLHLAQIPKGKLYSGSWSDWCSYLDGD